MRVGVFDSGIGGKSVANAIEQQLPELDVLFVHDTPDHFPYALKQPEEILGYVVPIFQELVDAGCDLIVIACNTVSTTLSAKLRGLFDTPMIALDPMVKPAAALTKSGVICVCATPTTLASKRYAWLKQTYGQACMFIEPDCSDWSTLIEHNQMNETRLRNEIEPVLAAQADVIVLACTHYHWIEQEIRTIAAGRAEVLQPETAVIERLKTILSLD